MSRSPQRELTKVTSILNAVLRKLGVSAYRRGDSQQAVLEDVSDAIVWVRTHQRSSYAQTTPAYSRASITPGGVLMVRE